MSIFRNKEKVSRKNKEVVNSVKALIYSKKDMKIFGITSCMLLEGKTTIAKKIASSITEDNKKVLYLDLDIRNAKGNQKGIAEVTARSVELQECIVHEEHFEYLAGGKCESITGLLASFEFVDIMAQLKQIYDYIIVDTPQLYEFMDAVQIADVCDGMIMVLEPYVVPYKMAVDCKRKLENASTPIIGVVMNKAD
ncbi:CpsD/CapB family tyrosine-protein kinase [Anaerosacchariphilus polymeriproducens]|uniref:Uncharacterized protein n=1 Tax=Anaerosacchariphilus polymeriproducens TaxID=1812858 RepID=A0A371ARE6_9FIRM|nr:CpsD/CapB family tyrosine-protein kinase [Anaerosacchariphilus polymeriproducens]RDU22104.1 hypothetical protein DWV06_16375 [Anaerosacchariphilus polymeriproducens]